MKIKEKNSDLIISGAEDFEPEHIFDCGQCFRWERISEKKYFGIAFGRALLLEKYGDDLIFYNTNMADFERIWYNYFDFGRDYKKMKSALSKDPVLQQAISYGEGIRILRQEPFETLISFIISASNNIPRIKGIINRLCENFGEKNMYMGKEYYTFPDAKKLSALSLDNLAVIRAGFRDKYILSAAKGVLSGETDLDKISRLSAADAKTELMKLSGVGNKVSDCILLFGMGKHESFPVDVWIKRIMEYCYFDGERQSIEKISELACRKFGEYGGFAQQYLFFWARENKIGI